jgi:hypothetical protein
MNDNRPWNMGEGGKPYTVSLWTDTPVETDSCMTGEDFATEKEARMCLADLSAHFPQGWDVPYILLDGPDVHEVTTRTLALKRVQREREADQRAWQREIANEAGMLGGIHAYNDAMGYDSEPYDPSIHDSEY